MFTRTNGHDHGLEHGSGGRGLHGFLMRRGWLRHRGGWGRRWAARRFSPERVEARMRRAEQRLTERLRLRPEQVGALREAMDGGLTLMRHSHDTALELRSDAAAVLANLEQTGQSASAGQEDGSELGNLLRRAVRVPPSTEAWDALIEQWLGFYRTLDPTQRAEVREHLATRGPGRWVRYAECAAQAEQASQRDPEQKD